MRDYYINNDLCMYIILFGTTSVKRHFANEIKHNNAQHKGLSCNTQHNNTLSLCWSCSYVGTFWLDARLGHFSNKWAFYSIFWSAYMTAIFTFSMYSVSVTPSIAILCHYADQALMLALFGLAIILAIFQTIGHFWNIHISLYDNNFYIFYVFCFSNTQHNNTLSLCRSNSYVGTLRLGNYFGHFSNNLHFWNIHISLNDSNFYILNVFCFIGSN
jgi:hypothetical protein